MLYSKSGCQTAWNNYIITRKTSLASKNVTDSKHGWKTRIFYARLVLYYRRSCVVFTRLKGDMIHWNDNQKFTPSYKQCNAYFKRLGFDAVINTSKLFGFLRTTVKSCRYFTIGWSQREFSTYNKEWFWKREMFLVFFINKSRRAGHYSTTQQTCHH